MGNSPLERALNFGLVTRLRFSLRKFTTLELVQLGRVVEGDLFAINFCDLCGVDEITALYEVLLGIIDREENSIGADLKNRILKGRRVKVSAGCDPDVRGKVIGQVDGFVERPVVSELTHSPSIQCVLSCCLLASLFASIQHFSPWSGLHEHFRHSSTHLAIRGICNISNASLSLFSEQS